LKHTANSITTNSTSVRIVPVHCPDASGTVSGCFRFTCPDTPEYATEDPPYGTYWVEVAENTTVAQLKAALESTDGSVQTYRVYAASDNDHEKDDSSIITITTNPSSADKIIVYAAAGGWKTFKIFVP